MNQQLEWDLYDKYNYIVHYIRYRKNQLIHLLTGKDYWGLPKIVAGKRLLSVIKTNQIIGSAILEGKPFWAGRYGGIENDMIYAVLQHRMHPEKDIRKEAVQKLYYNAGFFPADVAYGERFVDLMLKECAGLDLQGMWRRYMEDYIYMVYEKGHTRLTQLHHLEPWNMYLCNVPDGTKPWSAALKGKRVLVVHPFAETIEKQYMQKRDKIFHRVFAVDDILPEFELLTLQAVQTQANEQDTRFHDWFDALKWMVQECQKKDFDVAIIGCGAYGFLLAAEVKKMGKVAIHLGGATQLLFGIIGTRWERETPRFYRDVVNEYWVRPSAKERIKEADQIEQGCYW